MRLHEIICEAGDAPLFHFTSLMGLRTIMESDRLGTTLVGEKAPVSLTRDPNHYFIKVGRAEAALILDSRRLRTRYRMEPRFGDIRQFNEVFWLGQDDGAKQARMAQGREAEEQVIGWIEPLSRYLLEIVINDNARNDDVEWRETKDLAVRYCERHHLRLSTAKIMPNSAWLRTRRPTASSR